MDEKRSYGRVLVVSVLVGYLEVALTLVVVLLSLWMRYPPGAALDYAAEGAVVITLIPLIGVIAFLLSLLFVLPSVALAALSARRIGGPEALWAPLMVAALLGPPVTAFWTYNDVATRPMLVFWACATASLSAGALIARTGRSGLFRRVALWGAAVVAGTGVLGAAGLATGLLPLYGS
ncbi:hypothetical protein [Streptomyces sp. NPDC048603]|uniref:hypothetical protein n=1 Tax=Streptomyces sp. NPDC048603 TaxID=3365577 RepID=UPI0037152CBB